MNRMPYINAKTDSSSFHPIQGKSAKRNHLGSVKGLSGSTVNPLTRQPPLIQAKLTIGQPGDMYEHEADSVADTVMRMPEPAIQRK